MASYRGSGGEFPPVPSAHWPTRQHRAESPEDVATEMIVSDVRDIVRAGITDVVEAALGSMRRADRDAARWRVRFRSVAKINALGLSHRQQVAKIIERRIRIVEAIERDGRMRRAMVDLLRDLADDVEREWEL